ncbi:MAG: Cdc6-related protein AAA superfamily ATPase [Candidatus Methanohalarchaeum thermophilum]|uniref:Cdc6-related protein AAA superfamily ATPase n=1 Tax=Methanohalarchaeum thermophilum TaxID=1903181 RepID=A0A1Q6DS81_METT1|nr:MAG: Cdc6-related protein AAA superfamily ATPase [Candidatus Methanohalarchaeum thermophilum]
MIDNPEFLDTNYLSRKIIDRKMELKELENFVLRDQGSNLHLFGPRGSGKTYLSRVELDASPSDLNTCYISCLRHKTRYQVLSEVIYQLTGKKPKTGYHISQIQEKAKEAFSKEESILVVLDEVDFCLMNDGNDLLHFLSWLNQDVDILAISANYPIFNEEVDGRKIKNTMT